MLRGPQHERKIMNDIKSPPFVTSIELSAGSELCRRTPNEFFSILLAQLIPSSKTVRSRSMALSVIRVRS